MTFLRHPVRSRCLLLIQNRYRVVGDCNLRADKLSDRQKIINYLEINEYFFSFCTMGYGLGFNQWRNCYRQETILTGSVYPLDIRPYKNHYDIKVPAKMF